MIGTRRPPKGTEPRSAPCRVAVPVWVMPTARTTCRGHIGLHQLLHHLQAGTDGEGEQSLPPGGDDLVHRHAHLLGHGQHTRVDLGPLILLGHSGPLFVGLSWRTPNTYRKEGIERGTATSSSTRH